jgi:hypothetical protein
MYSPMGSRIQLFRLLQRVWRGQAVVDWLRNYFKAEDILPNGCIPSGHKFSTYGMCLVCGEYR